MKMNETKELEKYASAYDIDFLYNISGGNGEFVTIGRLIDKCLNFKEFKDFIGDDKQKQLEIIKEVWNLYDGTPCQGANLFDAVEHIADEYLD